MDSRTSAACVAISNVGRQAVDRAQQRLQRVGYINGQIDQRCVWLSRGNTKNVEDDRGITKTTDTAVPDLERDVPRGAIRGREDESIGRPASA